MAKKIRRWDKTYWTGFFEDGPVISLVCSDDGIDLKLPMLYVTKRHALKWNAEVRKVRLVEVKRATVKTKIKCCDGLCDGACTR